MLKIVKEQFKSISEMMNVLDKRPNNDIMRNQHSSSQKGERDWFGTESYEEASQLIRTGYTEILPLIKEGLAKSSKVVSKMFSPTDLRRSKNLPVGFIPHIPNSILNLPNSMIDIKISPQKRKTLSILYVMAGSAGCEASMWVQAGVALLTAIKIVERQGISISIDVVFYCGSKHEETAYGSVRVKHFGQPLDIQKLCFPLANPSMFRRIGFKFLETTPIITEPGFAYGYGRGFDCYEKEIKQQLENDKTYMFSGQWIKRHDYKVESILEYLNFSKNGDKSERKERGEQKGEE